MGYFKRVFAARRHWLNVIKENQADIQAQLRTGNEGQVVVFSDKILKRQGALGEMHALEGVTASIEDTRGGQVFLNVAGPEFAWLVDVTPKSDIGRAQLTTAAHHFAAQTNLAVRRFSAKA